MEYEAQLPVVLAALGVPPEDIVLGEQWTFVVNGTDVIAVRKPDPNDHPLGGPPGQSALGQGADRL